MNDDIPKFRALVRPDSDAQARASLHEFDDSFARAEWSESAQLFSRVECSLHPEHARVSMRLNPPLSAMFTSGRIGDVVWSYYGHIILSSRAVDIFRRAEITGYHTEPVELGGREYFLLHVTGWGGLVSAESNVYKSRYCEKCALAQYRVRALPSRVVDSSRWDGSDIFTVWPLPRAPFATARVCEMLTSERVTGIVCVPEAAVLRRSESYSPGRLSDYMPIEQAAQRGRDSGIAEM